MRGMEASYLPARETNHLDALLLDSKGRLKVVPTEVYQGIDPTDLRVWCHKKAFYALPTTELLEWLKARIGGRRAIEIGSGNGCLGRALGIPMTDNMSQNWPNVAMMYVLQRQPRVQYGEDVEDLDALAAVQKYQPQVVLGAWVTQWISPRLPPPPGGGSIFGIKEDQILRSPSVQEYIVVGNKLICSRPHTVIQEPGA